jgi:hypothetical protein
MAWAEVIATGGGEGVDGMLRVLVVDDHADFRQAFASLLDEQPDLEVTGQAGSLAEARPMLEGVKWRSSTGACPMGTG